MSAPLLPNVGSNSIKITNKQAKLLSALMRLPPNAPVETITRLALQDPTFCDRMLDILFPRRRPPSITPPVIHQCVRQLGPHRARHLFICNSIFAAFADLRLNNFHRELFWQDSLRRGFAAMAVAEEIEYPDPYEAFWTGFLSDIGTILLVVRFPNLGPHFNSLRTRSGDIRAQVERIISGANHCEEINRSGFLRVDIGQ